MYRKRRTLLCTVLALFFCAVFALSACTPAAEHTPEPTPEPPVEEPSPIELPAFYVNTKNEAQITSKEVYVTCDVTVDNTEERFEFSAAPAKIRGRGNSSWTMMPKKSYRLKFDSKTDLFGNGSAKVWTLIANYCDPSLARNYLAYSLGSILESQPFTTTTQFVQFYLNGRYNGVYLVCEQIQAGKTRVDIDESIDDLDTGYLLELDVRIEGVEGIDYFATQDSRFGRQCYQLKSPDPEDVTAAEKDPSEFINYIRAYTEHCLDTIRYGTYREICDLIDVDSFAESYLLNEWFNTTDIGESSFFYKKKGGKLYFGPVWDFDISTGNCNYGTSANSKNLWAKDRNIWYYYLLQHPEFETLVKEKLARYEEPFLEKLDSCIEYLYRCEAEFEKNFEVWDILGTYVWPNTTQIVNVKTWRGQVDYVKDWLMKSMKYIKQKYPTEAPENA